MKVQIQKILHNTSLKEVQTAQHHEVEMLSLHSQQVKPGGGYIAIQGTLVDGHDFIDQAIEKGAKVIFIEKPLKYYHEEVDYYISHQLKQEIGLIAANFYDHPSLEMKVVGVTGTNGKTTVATLLYQLFQSLGHQVGLISTIQYFIGTHAIEATHTTPNPLVLQSLLAKMKAAGCEYVFMEVSSHAIDQNRIGGIDFEVAVFTNLSHDHLDYHGTMDHYLSAKKKFFDDLKPEAFAITNLDDKRGGVMLQNTKAQKYTYALKHFADVKGMVLENQGAGLHMDIQGQEVHFLLNGLFNAYNILAVYAVAEVLGKSKEDILTEMSLLKGAAGRFEMIYAPGKNLRVVVDYAHTPDALENVLTTIQSMEVGGKIITIVGCGGDRDRTKRPLMRSKATEYSDRVILTSDNPRTENPEQILQDMMEGADNESLKKITVLTNRKEAIKLAIQIAAQGDVILIAGKGHETYQEVNGVRHHFDDKEEAMLAFEIMNIN